MSTAFTPANSTGLFPYAKTGSKAFSNLHTIDWGSSALKQPHTWPQPLHTTLQVLLDSPLPMGLVWGDTCTFFANDHLQALLDGTPFQNAFGKNIRETLGNRWPAVAPLLQQVLRGEAVRHPEFRAVLQKDAKREEAVFDLSCTPVRLPDGTTQGLLVTAIEKTEQVNVAHGLKTEKESLEAVIEAADLGTFDYYPQTGKIFWSARTKEMFGYPADKEVHFRDYIEALHPDDRRNATEATQKALAAKDSGAYENLYRTIGADGCQRWVRSIGRVSFNAAGKAVRITGITQDITERKLAESAWQNLSDQQEKTMVLFDSLVRNAPFGFVLFDIQHRFIRVNETVSSFNGLPANAHTGKAVEDVLPANGVLLGEAIDRVVNEKLPILHVEFTTQSSRNPTVTRHLLAGFFPVENEGSGDVEFVGTFIMDITDRKLEAEKLRRSEERFEAAVAAVEGIVWTNNASGEMEGEQAGWEMLTGQKLEQYQGFGWASAVHPDDAEPTVNAWNAAVREKRPFLFEHRVRQPDGAWRSYSVRAIPLLNQHGEIEEWVGVHTDITARKMAEIALQESETRFRVLAETLPQMIWVTDTGRTVEYTSHHWSEYCGVDGVEAWDYMIHPDDKEPSEAAFADAFTSGTPFRMEVRLQNKDGQFRWHSSVAEPVLDGAGNVVKWVGSLTDIHEQKIESQKLEHLVAERTRQLEAKNRELEDAQSFLQQLIDSSVEYISVLDRHLRYITANRQVEKTVGQSREDLRGKPIFFIFPTLDVPEEHAYLQRALAGEIVYLDMRPSLSKPGLFVDTYYVPLRIQNRVEGVIIMARDVSDIARTEQLLAEKNQELLRSNEDLEQFAHVASHDLKEPVRKVLTFATRIQDEFAGQLPEPVEKYLQRIVMASERMYAMIDGVLQYSSLNAAEQLREPVDVEALLKQIAVDLEVMIQEKGATISYGGLQWIHGTSTLLNQLFYNLISNALKFSKPGVPPVVKITSAIVRRPNTEPRVRLTVEDNGIGFKQDYAERVFQTFTRLHSKDQYEGTGLGLSLCKKIVDRHHGSISATSQEGIGTMVEIYLPLHA